MRTRIKNASSRPLSTAVLLAGITATGIACHGRTAPVEGSTATTIPEEEAVEEPDEVAETPEEAEVGRVVEPPPEPREMFPDGLPMATPATPEGLGGISAQGCNACHSELHSTWLSSGHATGASNEGFLAATRATNSDPACTSCHLPMLVQHPELMVEREAELPAESTTSPNPHWSPTLQQEGVTCAVCHIRDGEVLGVSESERSPHPVVAEPALSQSQMCATCHQHTVEGSEEPLYDTWGEWSRSGYPEVGLECQGCHMPQHAGATATGEVGVYASHASPADGSRAVTLHVEGIAPRATRGQEYPFEIELTNSGAGHALPTGSPFKALVVRATLLDGEGEPVADPFETLLQREVDENPPYATLSDSRLKPRESVRWSGSVIPSFRSEPGWGALQVSVSLRHSDGREDPPLTIQNIPIGLD